MSDCLFCKIAKGEIPTDFVYEDDLVVAFDDIHPQTPVHVLIIPKEHLASINDLPNGEKGDRLVGRMINVAKRIAKEREIASGGYKLLIRTGVHGGQEIPHIHLHLLGGGRMSEGIGLVKK